MTENPHAGSSMLPLGSDKRHQHIYLESHPANHGRGLATPIFRHVESRLEFVDAEFAVIEIQGQVTEFKARVLDVYIFGFYPDIGVHFLPISWASKSIPRKVRTSSIAQRQKPSLRLQLFNLDHLRLRAPGNVGQR
jgi:hypothetical protein